MGLVKGMPSPSSRMGIALGYSGVKGLAVLELGTMGHTLYQYKHFSIKDQSVRCNYYSTHMNEQDIIMGSANRLERAVVALIQKEVVEAIAVIPSSLGEIIGIDLAAEIDLLKTVLTIKKPLFSVDKGGLQYTFEDGLETALITLIQQLVEPSELSCEMGTFNILGGFHFNGLPLDVDRIKERLEKQTNGKCRSLIPLQTSIQDLRSCTRAAFNLVIGQDGILAAKWLEKNFQIPFTIIDLDRE